VSEVAFFFFSIFFENNSNARLVPSLRWMLRDLFARRRLQLQKDSNAADSFADVRAHFVSCIVSKLPHEEAVEMLEALIRAARPVSTLVNEIAIPTVNAVIGFLRNGAKLLISRPSHWIAWKTLIARLVQVGVQASLASSSSVSGGEMAMDAEDPNFVLAEVCAPVGILAGKVLLMRLDHSAVAKEELMASLSEAMKLQSIVGEVVTLLRREVEPSGPKRGLFDETGATVATAAVAPPSAENPGPDLLVSFSTESAAAAAAPLLSLKFELPLLKVDSVSASSDIPDELFPLPAALYAHSAKLLRLRSRLSRAELDQILLAAEALVMADPDRTLETDRALECLRGAILRPASSAMTTSSQQCCPRNDELRISIAPLWKLDGEDFPATLDPRSLMWRRALSASLQSWSDEEDTLIGMVPAVVNLSALPPVVGGSLVKAYGIMCRVLRDPPATRQHPNVLAWAKQWSNWCKVAAVQNAAAAILGSYSEKSSSMDSHERVDVLLRNPHPTVYCIEVPKLLLGEALIGGAQAVGLMMTHLVRCLRNDEDLTPIVHVILKAGRRNGFSRLLLLKK
jgi:hypothetical protein